jgi:hypothetical protein
MAVCLYVANDEPTSGSPDSAQDASWDLNCRKRCYCQLGRPFPCLPLGTSRNTSMKNWCALVNTEDLAAPDAAGQREEGEQGDNHRDGCP